MDGNMKPKMAALAVPIAALGASAVAQSASPAEPGGSVDFTFPTIDFPGVTIPGLPGIKLTGGDYGRRRLFYI